MNPRQQAVALWQALKEQIGEAYPELLQRIPPGVDRSALEKFEAESGLTLPPLVKEIYALHNGIGMPPTVQHQGLSGVLSPCDFLPFESAVEEWQDMKRLLDAGHLDKEAVPTGPVRGVWWSTQWFPIAWDGAGSLYCVDLDPAPGGAVGQIISFWHDDIERNVEASDLGEFLLEHVDEEEWAARDAKRMNLN